MTNLLSRIFTFALLVGLFSVPLWAADVPIGDVLTGKVAPLTIKIQDVTPTWSQFILSPGHDQLPRIEGDMDGLKASIDMFSTYYTKGATVTCNGETYLLAYCRTNPVPNMLKEAVMRGTRGDRFDPMVEFLKNFTLSTDTQLSLNLLNIRDSGNFHDIRAANTRQDNAELTAMMEEARGQAQQAASLSNLRQLALAVLMYAQENDEQLPAPAKGETIWQILSTDKRVTVSPVTKEAYKYNEELSGVALGEITEPANTPLFYDGIPMPDGRRGVCFVDGHVEMVNAARWANLVKEWKLK